MSHDENLQLAHCAWEAVAKGDTDALEKVWAPTIKWHVTGSNPWRGTHVGHEAICSYLADVGEIGEAYDTRLDDVLLSKDRFAMLTHVTARRAGKTVETDQLLVARIEGGLIAEVWTIPLDPAAFEGFYDPPVSAAGAQ